MRNLYIFNATGDLALANGDENYNPPSILSRFEKDLSFLPAFIGDEGDFVLSEKNINEQFLKRWGEMGVGLPNIVEKSPRPINALVPWSWNQVVHKQLSEWKPFCSVNFLESPVANWNPKLKALSSRMYALELLNWLYGKGSSSRWLIPEFRPIPCYSLEEVIRLQKNWGRIVLKLPWSSSGRGIQFLRNIELNVSNIQWIKSGLQQQGFLMVESVLEKSADFSLHFFVDSNGIAYRGCTKFFTSSNGAYAGHFLNFNLNEEIGLLEFINEFTSCYIEFFQTTGLNNIYRGWFGVDIMKVFAQGKDFFQPCVEINLRLNMGTLALRLNQHFPHFKGLLKIAHTSKTVDKNVIIHNELPKNRDDILFLTPPENALFSAWLEAM